MSLQAGAQALEVPETGPVEPPVLIGRKENPLTTMVGAALVLMMTLVIGLFAPAGAVENNGVRTSKVGFSGGALAGQEIYLAENCAACHTQQVRPIAADAGSAEKVTQADTNLVLGFRRYGPDLANVGARRERDALLAILQGADGHPPYSSLGETDLAELVAYLSESK